MKELDLTKGSVSGTLARFAVPFLLANVLQALYGGADLFVTGQFDDAASVAGVAIGSQVMQTVTGIILGLATGTTVLIAIASGSKNEREAADTIGTSIWLFGIIAAALTPAMTTLHGHLAQLMHTPAEAMADTRHYLLICSAGIPFITGYNVVCAILRGLGDSRTPLYFVGIVCFINIALDFILIGGCGMRAMGAAIATTASQGISFASALWYLHRKRFHFRFTRKDVRLKGKIAARIASIGAPIALQDALINVSFLMITVIVNGMGVIASAAVGVVEKIIVFAMLPPQAIASAVAAMTAQNYGAGLAGRVKSCLRSGIAMALVFGVSVCIYCQFFPETLAALFSNDSAVVAMAAQYLRGYSIDCIMVSFVFCINTWFSGQGNSLFPMIHSLAATFLFRIPLSWTASRLEPTGLVLMGYAPPASTFVIICLIYIRYWNRNYRTNSSQITEQFTAKLPNKFKPNYRILKNMHIFTIAY